MLRESVKLSAFAAVAAAFNYGYRIFVSRTLGIEAYGEVSVVLSVLNIFTLCLLSAIPAAVAKFEAEKKGMYPSVLKFAYLGVGASVVLGLVSPLLVMWLGLSYLSIAIIAVAIPIAVVGAGMRGVLQGRGAFSIFGLTQISESGGKLVFAVLLVFLGYKVLGAVAALLLGISIAALLAWWAASSERSDFSYFGGALRYTVPISVTRVVDALILNIDLLMLTVWYPMSVAGAYAIAGPLARIPLLAFGAIATVLLPAVSAEKRAATILTRKAFVLCGLVLAGMVVLFAFPQFFITLLFNPQLSIHEMTVTVKTMRALIIGAFFIGMYRVISASLQALGRASVLAMFAVFVLAVDVVAGVLFIPTHGMLGAALVSVGAAMLATIGSFALLLLVQEKPT